MIGFHIGYRWLACLLLGLLSVGCDAGPQRYAVSGTLTIDGEPVHDVTIVFIPVEEGLSGAATVTNGEFACSPEGGPTAGLCDIRISPNEAELDEVEADPSALATPRKPKVPLKYQRPGALQVEITGQPDQVLELDLEP